MHAHHNRPFCEHPLKIDIINNSCGSMSISLSNIVESVLKEHHATKLNLDQLRSLLKWHIDDWNFFGYIVNNSRHK